EQIEMIQELAAEFNFRLANGMDVNAAGMAFTNEFSGREDFVRESLAIVGHEQELIAKPFSPQRWAMRQARLLLEENPNVRDFTRELRSYIEGLRVKGFDSQIIRELENILQRVIRRRVLRAVLQNDPKMHIRVAVDAWAQGMVEAEAGLEPVLVTFVNLAPDARLELVRLDELEQRFSAMRHLERGRIVLVQGLGAVAIGSTDEQAEIFREFFREARDTYISLQLIALAEIYGITIPEYAKDALDLVEADYSENVFNELKLVHAGQRLNEANLVAGNGGNLSIRCTTKGKRGGKGRKGNTVLITASGARKGRLDSGDFIELRTENGQPKKASPNKPSTETSVHLEIYFALRKASGAVVHVHAPCVTALGTAGKNILPGLMAITPYRCAHGSDVLADTVAQAHKEAQVVVWSNHGISVFAPTIEGAVELTVAIEELSRKLMGDIFDQLCARGIVSADREFGRSVAEALKGCPEMISRIALQEEDIEAFQEKLRAEGTPYPTSDPARTDRPLTPEEAGELEGLVSDYVRTHNDEIRDLIEKRAYATEQDRVASLLERKEPTIASRLRNAIVIRAPPESELAEAVLTFEQRAATAGNPVSVSALNCPFDDKQDLILILDPTPGEVELSCAHEGTSISLRDSGLPYEWIHEDAEAMERVVWEEQMFMSDSLHQEALDEKDRRAGAEQIAPWMQRLEAEEAEEELEQEEPEQEEPVQPLSIPEPAARYVRRQRNARAARRQVLIQAVEDRRFARALQRVREVVMADEREGERAVFDCSIQPESLFPIGEIARKVVYAAKEEIAGVIRRYEIGLGGHEPDILSEGEEADEDAETTYLGCGFNPLALLKPDWVKADGCTINWPRVAQDMKDAFCWLHRALPSLILAVAVGVIGLALFGKIGLAVLGFGLLWMVADGGNADSTIEDLIGRLEKGDTEERQAAAQELGALGASLGEDAVVRGKIIPALIGTWEEKNLDFNVAASVALTHIGGAAVSSLIESLREGEPNVRKFATISLSFMGKPAGLPLIGALKDESEHVRAGAAEALGEIKDARAVEPLIVVLEKDSYWFARNRAVFALANIRDNRAIQPLRRAMHDKDGNVRSNAPYALAKIGEPALGVLIGALEEDDGSIRQTVTYAIGQIATEYPDIDLATAAQSIIQRVLPDENKYVRSSAVGVLGKIGPSAEQAIPELARICLEDSEEGIRQEAAVSLFKICAPGLNKYFADKSRSVFEDVAKTAVTPEAIAVFMPEAGDSRDISKFNPAQFKECLQAVQRVALELSRREEVSFKGVVEFVKFAVPAGIVSCQGNISQLINYLPEIAQAAAQLAEADFPLDEVLPRAIDEAFAGQPDTLNSFKEALGRAISSIIDDCYAVDAAVNAALREKAEVLIGQIKGGKIKEREAAAIKLGEIGVSLKRDIFVKEGIVPALIEALR
ncbi:MAG: HEAT repeat domain-containing protein, partial [Candidatus Omnitrophota bacterium]